MEKLNNVQNHFKNTRETANGGHFLRTSNYYTWPSKVQEISEKIWRESSTISFQHLALSDPFRDPSLGQLRFVMALIVNRFLCRQAISLWTPRNWPRMKSLETPHSATATKDNPGQISMNIKQIWNDNKWMAAVCRSRDPTNMWPPCAVRPRFENPRPLSYWLWIPRQEQWQDSLISLNISRQLQLSTSAQIWDCFQNLSKHWQYEYWSN